MEGQLYNTLPRSHSFANHVAAVAGSAIYSTSQPGLGGAGEEVVQAKGLPFSAIRANLLGSSACVASCSIASFVESRTAGGDWFLRAQQKQERYGKRSTIHSSALLVYESVPAAINMITGDPVNGSAAWQTS